MRDDRLNSIWGNYMFFVDFRLFMTVWLLRICMEAFVKLLAYWSLKLRVYEKEENLLVSSYFLFFYIKICYKLLFVLIFVFLTCSLGYIVFSCFNCDLNIENINHVLIVI